MSAVHRRTDEEPSRTRCEKAVKILLDLSTPEPNCGCWLWDGLVNHHGYGRFSAEGQEWLAHRFAWTAVNGDIPKGGYVLHSCDVPCCVNPDHLRVGSHSDNMKDKAVRNRGAKGVLNEEQIARVQGLLKRHWSHKRIADLMGVSPRTIQGYAYGKTKRPHAGVNIVRESFP